MNTIICCYSDQCIVNFLKNKLGQVLILFEYVECYCQLNKAFLVDLYVVIP